MSAGQVAMAPIQPFATELHREPRRTMYVPLRAPFDRYSPRDLLAHFSTRANVFFFPVADEVETRRARIDAILDNRFEFNHETHCLPAPIDWTHNPSKDVEWHILLHKFYYAVGLGMAYRETGDERYMRQWVALTDSWIAAVPPGFIAADVTGRRVQNWIYASYFFVTQANPAPIPADFHLRFLTSIAEQVNFLRANLTEARNHRTLELYAIFLAGVVFPELSDASDWRAFALPEIVRNMSTDLLADGVQCELSTDYHHLVLKNYLCVRRLAAANGIAVPRDMDAMLVKALEFSMHAHNPAGVVPSFSDGDVHGYLDLLLQGYELYAREDMRYVATRGRLGTPPSTRSAAFPDSGYYVVRSGWGSTNREFGDEQHLIFDCGPLGAGNHGHFDCLSFELAALGRSLVVDPGRYTYSEAGETNWRVRFRSTDRHNTVSVDNKNQTRYEPRPVKVGSRHAPGSVRYKVTGPPPEHRLIERASMEGFDLLHGRVASHEYEAVHQRRIVFVAPHYWVILDSMDGEREHLYQARFQLSELAQDHTSILEQQGTRILRSPGLLIAQPDTPAVALTVEQGYVSYRYGQKFPAPLACFAVRARQAQFITVLLPYAGPPSSPVILEIPVTGSSADTEAPQASAFSISLDGQTDFLFLAGEHPATYRFGSFEFRGRYLVVRKNALGTITRVHTHEGAVLFEAGYPIRMRGAELLR